VRIIGVEADAIEKGEDRIIFKETMKRKKPSFNETYHGYRTFSDLLEDAQKRGFITFAPQNLYIFRDRFRTLQRKANPLKKTLFSIIVPQHQQITDWLKSLEELVRDYVYRFQFTSFPVFDRDEFMGMVSLSDVRADVMTVRLAKVERA
jgi:hypothetical protein